MIYIIKKSKTPYIPYIIHVKIIIFNHMKKKERTLIITGAEKVFL